MPGVPRRGAGASHTGATGTGANGATVTVVGVAAGIEAHSWTASGGAWAGTVGGTGGGPCRAATVAGILSTRPQPLQKLVWPMLNGTGRPHVGQYNTGRSAIRAVPQAPW